MGWGAIKEHPEVKFAEVRQSKDADSVHDNRVSPWI